ncbi:MAG TPA: divalent-cation tolerance protein CutA [Vicinamibacterales bacterium]|jgi:periplasmic divalent cation tolerance protein|nr:divalent-cation tolerance protein CutA [Vicinamibacterales bacterium]
MDTNCVIVLTTIGSGTDGQSLAAVLVHERLAACVNVLPEMESTYRWKGGVESERERQVVIKTTADRVPALQARLHELHPYELPEFLVLAVGTGSEKFLEWIKASTAKTG